MTVKIKVSEEILNKVAHAIEIIDGYYEKNMVFKNDDGSYYNRYLGLDVSPESIIDWAKKIEEWEKEK